MDPLSREEKKEKRTKRCEENFLGFMQAISRFFYLKVREKTKPVSGVLSETINWNH